MKFIFLSILFAVAAETCRAAEAGGKGDPTVGTIPQHEPAPGSCMPIGLTATGELVFPWKCRAIIERYRGAISVDRPDSPARQLSDDPAKTKDRDSAADPDGRRMDAQHKSGNR